MLRQPKNGEERNASIRLGRFSLALLLSLAACEPSAELMGDAGLSDGGSADGGRSDGGVPDGGVPDGGVPDGGVPDGGGDDGPVSVPACANGTVASYLGTSCSQAATVFRWVSYTCASTPPTICASLGADGSNVNMRMDPNGPHTILVGGTSRWNVTAGQSVDVIIRGTVYGATGNVSWPHFQGLNGQSGDGTSENKVTVDCTSTGSCLDANAGVCDVLCGPAGPATNCTDQPTEGPYMQYQTKFNAAPPENPYDLTIEIKLAGNTGTATLRSVGMHVGAF